LVDSTKSELKSGIDVIDKVGFTTICGSSVHIVNGHMPTQPVLSIDHEYMRVVESVGLTVKWFKTSDRVVIVNVPGNYDIQSYRYFELLLVRRV